MAKKTTRRKTKKKTIFQNKKIVFLVLSIVLLLVGGSAFIGGYYFAKSTIKPKTKIVHEDIKTKEALKQLQKLVDENINKKTQKTDTKITHKKETNHTTKTKKAKKLVNSEAIDYQENNHKNQEIKQIKPVIYTHKPKLVIIMDDMSFYSQVKELKQSGIKITPSFFPPSKRHPNTAKYAKEFKHYMVHFPMQATNPNFKEEVNTLHTNSSLEFIENRVANIKKEFPKAKFINNHTGSKFTADYNAMNNLYIALNKYNMIFIDSRTTSKTKAGLISKKYHKLLLSRDVFLDNKSDIKYIQNQLKQAIKIAKKRGYAIAICHPHPKTFEALIKSKKMLKNVEVIYIDELYKLYKTNKLSKI
jgi:polysaccharide deacetylase 2 family uncharacterized protein YibQ/nitrate reductase NapE component